jgi:drug/metabolite transporter (DMT)-like permease
MLFVKPLIWRMIVKLKLSLNDNKIKTFLLLHLNLLIYSLSSVCSKIASGNSFFSLKFIVFYVTAIAGLLVYAILWQQVLKELSLITAYSNKAFVMVWGMIWGILLFKEKISWNMIAGAIIIAAGVYMVVSADE